MLLGGVYNKLAIRKIGLLEIVEKINPNAYQLKLPSHIKTSDVFNVKHIVPYTRDSLDYNANSMMNSLQPREDNVDKTTFDFMKKTREDMCV